MSNATISAADQVAAAFDFTVDKFPLSGPDGMRTPWYAMFRSDSSEVVGEGSVTDRYTPHQTEDVVALVDACESVFDEASQVKTHFRNGHYVSIAPSDDYRRRVFDVTGVTPSTGISRTRSPLPAPSVSVPRPMTRRYAREPRPCVTNASPLLLLPIGRLCDEP